MSDTRAERLRLEGMAFWGKLIAAESHEVINAFSVINEMAGLQTDILQAAGPDGQVDVLDLADICEKVRNHVRRGERRVRALNWVAHTVDAPVSEIELKDMLPKLMLAAEHWARIKKIEIATDFPEAGAAVETSLFFLAYGIFLGMEAMASSAGEGWTITLGFSRVEGGVEITLTNSDPLHFNQEVAVKIASLGALVEELGGELKTSQEEGELERIAFFVPRRRQR